MEKATNVYTSDQNLFQCACVAIMSMKRCFKASASQVGLRKSIFDLLTQFPLGVKMSFNEN